MTYMLRKNEAIDLVTKYSRSTFLKEEFCKSYYITARLFDSTLRVAIINNWISDETVAELKAKSLKRNSGQEVIEFWERLEKTPE